MKHLIVGYSNKANNNIKNILGVVGNIGLMDHVVLFLPYSNWVFHQRDILPDESSQFLALLYHVLAVKYKNMRLVLVKLTENLHILS